MRASRGSMLSNARIESVRLGIGASFLIVAWLCFGPSGFLLLG